MVLNFFYYFYIIIIIINPKIIGQLDENFIILKIKASYTGNYQIFNNIFNDLPSEIFLNGNKTNVGKSIFINYINGNTQENTVKIVFNY